MKPYDPKLREAAEEFELLCKRYDVVGVCLFVSPTHSEFVNELSPSWSIMKIEDNRIIRFRSKRAEFPSKEAQYQATNATAHAVTSVVNWSRQTHGMWGNILYQLQSHIKIFYSIWDKPDSTPGDGQ
jgi:hypothetical protein